MCWFYWSHRCCFISSKRLLTACVVGAMPWSCDPAHLACGAYSPAMSPVGYPSCIHYTWQYCAETTIRIICWARLISLCWGGWRRWTMVCAASRNETMAGFLVWLLLVPMEQLATGSPEQSLLTICSREIQTPRTTYIKSRWKKERLENTLATASDPSHHASILKSKLTEFRLQC